MLRNTYFKQLFILLVILINTSCEDYLEVDTPKHKIVSATVFEEDETAISTMTGIYNELLNADFSGGWNYSVSVLGGLSSDVLEPVNPNSVSYAEFNQNEISPNSEFNFYLWSSTFNIIYMTNALLEGLSQSEGVSEEISKQLEGEARFIRAFTYFYLVNLYGDVPLILSTDYEQNSLIAREGQEQIYELIIDDLQASIELLENTISETRTRADKFVVTGMLARVYLYLGNWEQAEFLSSQVIAESSKYELLENLDEIFLPESKEAIWQISPVGRGNILTSTNEGLAYVGSSFSSFKISDEFVNSFNSEDKRLTSWIGFYTNATRSFHFPYKYKDGSSISNITEYSMVLRLAEQFLIRAEARAQTGDFSGAINDLDKIRTRSNLESISGSDLEINQENLISLILEERKRELFSEWGHRWLDLKRTNRASSVLGPLSDSWEDTDVLYPIPERDRMKNPNLTQNDGY